MNNYTDNLTDITDILNPDCYKINTFKNTSFGLCWMQSVITLLMFNKINMYIINKIYYLYEGKLIATKFPNTYTDENSWYSCYFIYICFEIVRKILNICLERMKHVKTDSFHYKKDELDLLLESTCEKMFNFFYSKYTNPFIIDIFFQPIKFLFLIIQAYSIDLKIEYINFDYNSNFDDKNIFYFNNCIGILYAFNIEYQKQNTGHVISIINNEETCIFDSNNTANIKIEKTTDFIIKKEINKLYNLHEPLYITYITTSSIDRNIINQVTTNIDGEMILFISYLNIKKYVIDTILEYNIFFYLINLIRHNIKTEHINIEYIKSGKIPHTLLYNEKKNIIEDTCILFNYTDTSKITNIYDLIYLHFKTRLILVGGNVDYKEKYIKYKNKYISLQQKNKN